MNIQRAHLLLRQSRYGDAERELRSELMKNPDFSLAHSLLGYCLLRQQRRDEAQTEIEQAIGLEPDSAFAHHCRSILMLDRRQLQEAESSAREAIQLDSSDADYWGQLSVVLQAQKRWQESLEAAEQGLACDAEDVDCENLRALALRQLGRKDDALASVESALSRDPDNAFAHATKGWTLLHNRQPQPALEAFREALRLDPNLAMAQQGIVEALKARYFIYRWILAYFLFMNRFGQRAQWGIILGGYLGYRILGQVARDNPAIAPWIRPLLIAYMIFALLTWFSVPLFNLLLRLNRFGRHALSADQRAGSNWFGVCLVAFLLAVWGYFTTDVSLVRIGCMLLGLTSLSVAMPVSSIYLCERGWPRRHMTCYVLAICAIGGFGAWSLLSRSPDHFETAMNLLMLSLFASPFVANYLMSARPQR